VRFLSCFSRPHKKLDGKLILFGEITVAKDGKSRTVTINGTDASGKKFSGKTVYDKA
jgi:hypothetical protein